MSNFSNKTPKSNYEKAGIMIVLNEAEKDIQEIQHQEKIIMAKNIQFFRSQYEKQQKALEEQFLQELKKCEQQLNQNIQIEQSKFKERVKQRIKLY